MTNLKEAKEGLKYPDAKDMYDKIVKNLSNEDPEKIESYHDTPYIQEYELEE